jgi:hypothetical protein
MPVRCDFAQEHLDSIGHREACEWCKHPFKDVYRAGLCRHCYKIKSELRALHNKVEHAKRSTIPRRGDLISPMLSLDYMTAIDMAEDAQWEGRKYGSLYNDDVTSLDLEHEFCFISKTFLTRDLYNNSAFLFDRFTASQKRYLLYILSRMSREYLRRKRRFRSIWRVVGKDIKEVLEARSPGTYRVEEEVAILRKGSDVRNRK